ncbi:hypothetical protein NCCP2716_25750 [Sporosarcina sp. NCCP-2716]|uniref:GNAT family N-acetyltransferase n=1 Tax=Sporosarcina sp. NCCP-2716 TaxID=2943679 RepID=UPI00203EF97C|nr:GNAT family N-acetyltransferase [Sporosarcina sp. NCCP-2716]GKV70077.1 hypothetical protein NCCP2716_25750 [Sporosarcina sp. NCCP-2716]
MKLVEVAEYDIDGKLEKDLQKLLRESFGEMYPTDRSYYKQLPHFRFIITDEDEQVMGQVGADYRVMSLNGKPIRVLGVIDLCVSEAHRSKGIGSFLLAEIDNFCKGKNIDFVLLFADNPALYLKNGYSTAKNNCKWLQIDEVKQTTYGIGMEVNNELMIKKLGNENWASGDLDLLGYLY